jgi:hypothetical protein
MALPIECDQPAICQELTHAFVFKVLHQFVFFISHRVSIQEVSLLDRVEFVFLIEVHCQRELVLFVVSVLVPVDESVMKEKPVVRLGSVAVINLLMLLDIIICRHDKPITCIIKRPVSFVRTRVIEHVGEWHQHVRVISIDTNSKVPAGNQLDCFCELFMSNLVL